MTHCGRYMQAPLTRRDVLRQGAAGFGGFALAALLGQRAFADGVGGVGAATDVGRVRHINQDSLVARFGLYAVADGMGGHASGEVASKMSAETIGEFYQRTREDEEFLSAV